MHGIAGEKSKSTVQMQCLPLFRFVEFLCTQPHLRLCIQSLILALGNPRVDLLSLDIEGAEYLVLQTLPWEKVHFGHLTSDLLACVVGGHQGNKCGDPVCGGDNGGKQRRYLSTSHQQRIYSPRCHFKGRVINNPIVILVLI